MEGRKSVPWMTCFGVLLLGYAVNDESRVLADDAKVSPFRKQINALRIVAPDRVLDEVFRLPEGCQYNVEVSPNGLFLAVCHKRKEEGKKSCELVVVELKSRRKTVHLQPLVGNKTILVPADFRWSPDSTELYVRWDFADFDVGGFWLQWDWTAERFTAEAEVELRKLRSIPATERPDSMSHPKGYGEGPFWSVNGKKYHDLSVTEYLRQSTTEAESSLVWRSPKFQGSRHNLVYLPRENQRGEHDLYEVFQEVRRVQHGDGREHHSFAHVSYEGQWIETFRTPCCFVPDRLLFEYGRDDELWIYSHNLQGQKEQCLWKTNPGRVRLSSLIDLTESKGREVGDALLVLESKKETTVQLIHSLLRRTDATSE